MKMIRRSIGCFGVLCSVLTAGCSTSTGPRLSYEGHSAIVATSPTVVDAVVTVRNVSATTAQLSPPVCPLSVKAYANAERSELIWESGSDACVTILLIPTPILIASGDYYDFTVRATIPASLAGKHVFLAVGLPQVGPVPVGQVTVK